MEGKDYKLTIAIPTYNRKESLERCIRSILTQINDQVEIYVSDNCSSDGTYMLFENEFVGENIRYSRNEKNIGPDLNFIKCFDNGRGEYIHMISDDDIMLPGTVSFILACISHNPSMIYLRACDIASMESEKEDFSYRIFYNVKDFFDEVGIFITLISTMVLKKEYILQIKDKTRFVGTNFPQSYIAIECLSRGECAISKNIPAIAYKKGDAHGYNFYQVWIYQYLKLLNYLSITGFSRKDIRRVIVNSLRREVFGLLVGNRVYGTKLDMTGRKYLLKGIRSYPEIWVRFLLAAYLPTPLMRIASKVKHVWRRIIEKYDVKELD